MQHDPSEAGPGAPKPINLALQGCGSPLDLDDLFADDPRPAGLRLTE